MTGRIVPPRSVRGPAAVGFSLIELLVAIAVFLIVSAAAFTLFNNQQTLLTQEQGVAGLNIGLRNALTQIQMDGVNAGNGIMAGAYAPAWPVGFTVLNQNPGTACDTGAPNYQYGSTCFDKLVIIVGDQNTPPCTLFANLNTNTQSTATMTPASGTAAAYYTNFKSGDELVVVDAGTSGTTFTTVTLTANATQSGSNIAIAFTSTGTTGINPNDSPGPPGIGYLLTTYALPSYRGVSYTAGVDYVVRLAPITYYVDTTNANDPKLMRQVRGGTATLVMDQIVSFKIGAALVNDSTGNYYFNAAAATNQAGGYGSDYSLIRSLRVNLMARTNPNGTVAYENQFDHGPYQVLGGTVVINPRNLSMNDQ